jgi:hypothetical protein
MQMDTHTRQSNSCCISIELHWKLINGFPLIETGLSYLIDKHWLMDFAFDSYVQLMED